MKRIILLLIVLTVQSSLAAVDVKFTQCKQRETCLKSFLSKMPIAGDLHNHFDGAMSIPYLISLAGKQGYRVCDDYQICQHGRLISGLIDDPQEYRKLIAAWSMAGKSSSGDQHFFSTFTKFHPVVLSNQANILAHIISNASKHKIHYLELLIIPDDLQAMPVTTQQLLTDDFATVEKHLKDAGIQKRVKSLRQELIRTEHAARKIHQLKHPPAVVYQVAVMRNRPPIDVFRQLLQGFMLAQLEPRVVAVNLVHAEDGDVALRDYAKHMQMLDYLHQKYPNVKISLHAGELSPANVSKHGAKNHIEQAITLGHASRIGHGVSLPLEPRQQQLIRTIVGKQICFEVSLSSNHQVLDLAYRDHPLPWFLENHIPVTLSSDDAGILNTTLKQEYQLAIQHHDLDYQTVKLINRNSLHFAFIAGDSIWQSVRGERLVVACRGNDFSQEKLSKSCRKFLQHSPKASLQWQFEKSLAAFEKAVTNPELANT